MRGEYGQDQSPPRTLDLAALFMTQDPRWADVVRRLGWWILLCPPLGWLIALGYRKEVVLHFKVSGAGPLPAWPGTFALLREGFKALGVISLYLAPALILSWQLGAREGWADPIGGLQYMLCSLTLVPVTLPATPLVYMSQHQEFLLSGFDGALIFALSTGITFLIPAGFMRVAIRGSFVDALHLPEALRTLSLYRAQYIRAWSRSLQLSVVGVSLLIFSPWGIAWSYLGIVLCFNEVLASSSQMKDASPYRAGWLVRERTRYEAWTAEVIEAALALTPRKRRRSIIKLWGVYLPRLSLHSQTDFPSLRGPQED